MLVITVVKVLWVVAAVGLTALVLLHSPKGDGLGALGGQAQLFTSTKSAETTLNRVTWALTVVFMGLTVVLSAGWLNVPPLLNYQSPDIAAIGSPSVVTTLRGSSA
jgi:preprotein translocase subunit SecG